MNKIPDTNAVPDGLIVKRGLPAAANAPRLADVMAKIQAEAEKLGRPFERLEIRKASDPKGSRLLVWAVARVPDTLPFESLDEARMELQEELAVEVWEDVPPRHPRSLRRSLVRLLGSVVEANERVVFNAEDAEDLQDGFPFPFPSEWKGCSLRVLSAAALPARFQEQTETIEEIAKRMGCFLSLVWVDHEDAMDVADVPAYWALVSSDASHRLQSMEEAREWLGGMVRARTSLVASEESTLKALSALRVRAERRLADSLA